MNENGDSNNIIGGKRMITYKNWMPTLACPTIEKQVAIDIEDALKRVGEYGEGVSGANIISDFLYEYRDYLQEASIERLAEDLASTVTGSMQPLVAQALKQYIKPYLGVPLQRVYPCRRGENEGQAKTGI
ncbi:MAG: hypothetical protein PHE15_02835 [Dehalococcoidales bacterium]|nr:hypothetical protein [Dehalococcoidales bacterium]